MGKYLDELTEESKMFSKLSVALMDFPHGASDGWRKKYCNQGAGLMNSAVMGNSGALLFKVMDCSDVRKDAAGISELLSTMGAEIMGGEAQASGFGGWTVDNTRTNMAALSRLKVSWPTWICVGCIAHGLSLAIKDFAGQIKSTKGHASQTFGCPWLLDNNHAANTIASCVKDSGSARPCCTSNSGRSMEPVAA
jgi:hypothetical protein